MLGADGREDARGVLVARSVSARIPEFDSASIERSSGIFESSASPVHDSNAVGTHSSAPLGFSRMDAGDEREFAELCVLRADRPRGGEGRRRRRSD